MQDKSKISLWEKIKLKFSSKQKKRIKQLEQQLAYIEYDLEKTKNKFNETSKKNFWNLLDIYVTTYNAQNIKLEDTTPKYGLYPNKCEYLKYLFKNIKIETLCKENRQTVPDYLFLWGMQYWNEQLDILNMAYNLKRPLFLLEDGFLRSGTTWVAKSAKPEYQNGISFVVDTQTIYPDATKASDLELMLNDKSLIITDEQKARAKECMDKIVETHLTKYNHQPIYTPEIGRKGVKKILVVDQSYGDMSIAKGLASDRTFEDMLEAAIKENPDADIIVKTHPDTIAGAGGYYKGLKAHDNVYTMTDAINPISLIKYCDKVYVCTTQLGFEALMCGKETHVFGMPFYAGWGLTNDRQKCERRTNTRSLEEVFYIAYIMYSYYVNPNAKSRCEIEEAMDYLLGLRGQYFKEFNIKNEMEKVIV